MENISVTTEYLINNEILVKEVRLIDDQTNLNIIISTKAALYQAATAGLDLVIISDSSPPIAKILDYDKFRYEMLKRKKDVVKRARALHTELKEIQLRPVTDPHDIQIKAKRAQKFLSDGDKVKIIIKFKGREVSHAEMGRKILENMLSILQNHKIENPIALNGRDMVVTVAPIKIVVPSLLDAPVT